jgi:hypothetical protein
VGHLKSIDFRHLDIHQDEVIYFFPGFGQGFFAIIDRVHLHLPGFQVGCGNQLVDLIVFCQQDAQALEGLRLRDAGCFFHWRLQCADGERDLKVKGIAEGAVSFQPGGTPLQGDEIFT